jgi:Cu(I)/Ag(I) efflux system membrane fusion protein
MTNGRSTMVLVCALLATASSVSGCSKGKDATPPQSSLSTATRAQVDEVVSAYEVVRKALAADSSDVTTQSRALADSAKNATASVPEPVRSALEDVASAASRLAEGSGGDLDAARTAFGEVSRALISVLSSDPGLQAGRHVYECPMAKGYKKWVQISEGVSNPYMGSEMLQCGEEAAF